MKTAYELHIKLPDSDNQVLTIHDRLVLGSAETCDVCISDYGLSPKHLIFTLQKDVLILTHLGKNRAAKINRQKMEQGKTYILDHDDKITVGDIQILIQEFELAEEGLDDESLFAPLEDDNEEEYESDDDDEISDDLPEEGYHLEDDIDLSEASPRPEKTLSIDVAELIGLRGVEKSAIHRISKKLTGIFKRPEGMGKRSLLGSKKAPMLKASSKNKRSSGTSLEMPGLFLRFMAFLLNIMISILATLILMQKNFLDRPDIRPYLQRFLELLDQGFVWAQSFINTQLNIELSLNSAIIPQEFILTAFIYLALEITTSLLFGVSIGHRLLGIREISDFIPSRLKVLIRLPLSWLTTPFIIFDLPLLFKRRPLKEWLSGSTFEKRSPLLAAFSIGLLMPALILFCVLVPFLYGPSAQHQFGQQNIIIDRDEVERFHYYRINSFNIDIPWSEQRDSLALFEWQETHRNPHYALSIWNDRMGPSLMIKRGQTHDLKIWLRSYFDFNIFAQYLNPELFAYAYNRIEAKSLNELRPEIIKLFELSFAADKTNLPYLKEALIGHGPLLTSLDQWRSYIIQELALRDEDKIEYFNLDKNSWLLITRPKDEGHLFELIYLHKAPIESLIIESSTMSYQAMLHFMSNTILYTSPSDLSTEGYLKLEHDFKDRWLVLPLIDTLNTQLGPSLQNIDPSLYEHLYELLLVKTTRIFNNDRNILYNQTFIRELDTLARKLRSMNSHENPEFQDFTDKINQLNNAFIQNRVDFFNGPEVQE